MVGGSPRSSARAGWRSPVRLQQLKERLRHQALHDGLTGLPNRTSFNGRLERARHRPDGPIAIAFIDLDDFKLGTDSLGHDAGDQVLVAVAERLRRWGGWLSGRDLSGERLASEDAEKAFRR